MADWPAARLTVAESSLAITVLATFGAAWLFAPRGVPLRGYGALLFLPLAARKLSVMLPFEDSAALSPTR